jgi:hypothetical protein
MLNKTCTLSLLRSAGWVVGHCVSRLLRFVYNPYMLIFLSQLLAIYLFAATPCFAGWIANGGKREDIGIPIICSIFLATLLMILIYFFV